MTSLSKSLINWYSYNKRNLPWRETKNPYYIWISEIILQQTRVNQGLSYYYKFIEKFPDIDSLASADIDELLNLWQGLGYYSRARNMHFTAQNIVKNYEKTFPTKYKELIKLKGIGDYTASAIASISFNQPTPVLDGNVFRFIARYFGVSESTQSTKGKQEFKKILFGLIPEENPGVFNQAIMEFGALQCIPKNPDCISCPYHSECFAYKNNLIDELPAKKKKVKQTVRYFNYLFIIYNDFTFIEKRTGTDIWKLLYQFPLIETNDEISLPDLTKRKEWINIFKNIKTEIDTNYIEQKHILSHQKLITRFYKVKICTISKPLAHNYLKTNMVELHNYGIPKLLENYLEIINK